MTRVLLIDDEPRVSRALEYALADRDFDLLSVSDAVDLDALATPQVPDVILLDIALAHQDGLEVCRQLRADPRFQDVPEIDVQLLDRPDLPSVGAGETPIICIAR